MSSGVIRADAKHLPIRTGTVQAVVTSPAYWGQRDYGADPNELGEGTLQSYLDDIARCAEELHRVTDRDAVAWVNVGDSMAGSGGAGGDYNAGGSKENAAKWRPGRAILRGQDPDAMFPSTIELRDGQQCSVPERVADEFRRAGWLLRANITWVKASTGVNGRNLLVCPNGAEHGQLDTDGPNVICPVCGDIGPAPTPVQAMIDWMDKIAATPAARAWIGPRAGKNAVRPESITHVNRPLLCSERVLLFAKHPKHRMATNYRCVENGDVWHGPVSKGTGHAAPYPEWLVERCLRYTFRPGETGLVFDPFIGSGTTGAVARRLGLRAIGTDLYPQGT